MLYEGCIVHVLCYVAMVFIKADMIKTRYLSPLLDPGCKHIETLWIKDIRGN